VYLLTGALMWGYLSFVFFEVSFAITWERWEGTIEYTFMAPVRRVTHLMGICLFSVAYGLIRTAVVVGALLLFFHLDLSHADLWSAAAVLAVSTVPLVGMGILASILSMLSPEKGEQMAVAVQGFLLLVSGVYYPVSVLPLPLRLTGAVSPLTYTLDGIRGAVLKAQHVPELLPVIGLLALMGLVMVPLALGLFSLAERRAKRLGLLKRSG